MAVSIIAGITEAKLDGILPSDAEQFALAILRVAHLVQVRRDGGVMGYVVDKEV